MASGLSPEQRKRRSDRHRVIRIRLPRRKRESAGRPDGRGFTLFHVTYPTTVR
jgi:hypothetical protein